MGVSRGGGLRGGLRGGGWWRRGPEGGLEEGA